MIRLHKAEVGYGAQTVLTEADFHLSEQCFAYLTGKSGSGKSTLLKLITGEITPTGGTVAFAGRAITDWKTYELRRRIGVVYQTYELLDDKTVAENLQIAALLRGLTAAETKRQTAYLLQRVELSDREHAYPRALSGGEQQRVAVARALIGSPQLILADEPTGNLDAETARELMRLLFTLQREEGLTVLVVTHDLSLVAEFPAQTWTIEDGKTRCL